MSETKTRGRLDVVATPIGNLDDASPRLRQSLREADIIFAEDTRRTRQLLRLLGLEAPRVERFDANVEASRVDAAVERLAGGARCALVSDAGTPNVSDPGAGLVYAAGRLPDVDVQPVPGPSAVMAALAVCGFAGDRFRFFGFLPRGGEARRARLADMVQTSETVVFFEAPSRLASTLAELADRMGSREAMVARELTKLHEELVFGTLDELSETRPWQGEVTVVLGPWQPEAAPVDIEARILALRGEGLRDKDVAKAIALETGLSSSDAYRRVIAHKREGDR